MTNRSHSGLPDNTTLSGKAHRRRGLLGAAAALAAGWLARSTATPALAGTDGDLVLGAANSASNTTTLGATAGGVSGALLLSNTGGRGLVVSSSTGFFAINATGNSSPALNAITTTGDGIVSTSNSGTGILGQSVNGGTGIFGNASGSNPGVLGANSAGGDGVQGQSTNGIGVHGTSGGVTAVYGASQTGVGVRGDSGQGPGVVGTTVTNHGVFGDAAGGNGVFGRTLSGAGVFGQATTTGNGTQGLATSGAGVYGSATSGFGVFGTSGSNAGVAGQSANNNAVFGDASAAGNGLFGRTVNGNGLVAQATGGGNAAQFFGNVIVQGNFTVAPGFAKSGAIAFADGTVRRLYATEAPESWFEDYGEARLVNGRASVPIPADFAQAVNTSLPYYVFLTGHSADIEALNVTVRAPDHFEVQANGKGQVEGSFAYRIVAKRKDVAGPRFERVTLSPPPSVPAADAALSAPVTPEAPKLPSLTPEQRAIPTPTPPRGPITDGPGAQR